MSRAKSKQVKDKQRLKVHIQTRNMTQKQQDIARYILLNHCFLDLDLIPKEKCFTKDTEPTICDELKETFGFVPTFATNHVFGEVLNYRK